MKTLSILASILALAVGPVGAQTLRVGTFQKQAVVVAFYRSPVWAETMKGKLAERDAAKKANDNAKVQELETWGAGHQELAHHQLAGEAPITNIMEALAPAFPEIARRAGVNLIAPDLAFADPTVQKVDITDLLLTHLNADARTLDIIHNLPKPKK